MRGWRVSRALGTAAGLAAVLVVQTAAAYTFDIPLGDESISAVLNSTATAGAGVRMQSPNVDLIGKSNLDRNVCNYPNQSCQGMFRTQTYPAAALAAAPGQYSMHNDDGNLNYAKHDLMQGVAKLTQDLSLTKGDFGLFARWLYFYDAVNNDFTENHPNMITPENVNQVGRAAPTYPGGRVYGPGGQVYTKRTDGEVLRQAGTNLQALDSYIYGSTEIYDGHKATLKLGRQTISWGESTTLIPGSINSINPINANNFRRIGMQLEEIFTPVNMAFLSVEPFDNATLDGYYQLEWQPTEAPTPGTYFSTIDGGTRNTVNHFNLSFGGAADDPYRIGSLLDSPLALITNTTADAGRLADREPSTWGQFGINFKYYFENLGNGTEIGLYFERYHSRLPIVSFYSIDASCARAAGNSRGIDATNTLNFLLTCPDTPLVNFNDPKAATSSVLALDSGAILLEYPKGIQLYGISFNTTVGEYSIQGEAAYRPRDPLQVAITDLEFMAAGPGLTNCMDPKSGPNGTGCAGTSFGVGTDSAGNRMNYGSSDFVRADGTNPYPDTFNLVVGHLPGVTRSFPSFVSAYRGVGPGQTPPNSYIPGYQRFSTVQLNLGATRVLGASDNWLGASQILMVGELGAVIIPGLPPLDVLQIDGPATVLHASAGADGSGADGSRQACANNVTCSYGGDGLRFNPHQQDLTGYVDKLSWGYRMIGIIKYESVLPNVSVQPTVILSHDVQGTSPGPAFNFVAGRKEADLLIETRYRASLSLGLGYSWYWGGGEANLLSDRDYAQAFVKYQF